MKKMVFISLMLGTSFAYSIHSDLSLRHREGQGVGYNQGYSTVDYFLTSQHGRLEFLFNLRGHLFNDAKAAGNIGLGTRYSMKEDFSRLGLNLYYDIRDFKYFFAQQAGCGLEWISQILDIRMNGYLPLGHQRGFKSQTFQGFTGNVVLIKQKFMVALPSAEIEVGTALAKPFYFAAGSYYLFKESKHSIENGHTWGGKLRVDAHVGSYITLGGIITHDRIFKTRVQGYLSLNIPLGRFSQEKEHGRNLQTVPIMRHEIIPIQTHHRSREPLVSPQGEIRRFLFVNNKTIPYSGNGTFEKPFMSLKEAEKASQPGDIIYVFAGDGTARFMNEGIILKESQILVGSATDMKIEDIVIPAQTPGRLPVITNIHFNEPIIQNPGATQLHQFLFQSPWEYLKNIPLTTSDAPIMWSLKESPDRP